MAALHCHHKIQQDLQPKWAAQLPEVRISEMSNCTNGC